MLGQKSYMNTLRWLVVVLFGLPALSEEIGPAAMVYLTRASDDLGASYWVPWSSLRSQRRWSGAEPFPASIRETVDAAAREVLRTRDFTNDFRLQEVIIRRPDTPRTREMDPDTLTDQWVVAAGFLVQRGLNFSAAHWKREVLLLDGTVA